MAVCCIALLGVVVHLEIQPTLDIDITRDNISQGGMALRIREYLTADGKNPFRDWLGTLDVPTRARMQARILRFELGNLGDHKALGDGLWEARLMFGPGYRLYFGRHGKDIVVLLVAGSKASQRRDIRRARLFWKEYLESVDRASAQ